MTFLLGSPPYNYSTLDIGLFGLIGMVGVCTAPFSGRLIDRIGVPWICLLIGALIELSALAIYVGGAGISAAAVAIPAFLFDVGAQQVQVSNATRIQALDPAARARLNSIFVVGLFVGSYTPFAIPSFVSDGFNWVAGQVIGTRAGTAIFLRGGWRASGGFMMGCIGLMILLNFVRGPHEPRYTWFGWSHGTSLFKKKAAAHEEESTASTKASSDLEKEVASRQIAESSPRR